MSTKRNLRGLALERYKQTLKLTDQQREVLIGTLLGDASMSLRNGKPHYSVKFEQCKKRKEYINHLYQIFEPFVGGTPTPRFLKNEDSIVSEKLEENIKSYWFRTYEHKSLIFYYNYFYKIKNGKKVKIVPKTIHKFLTARALAYWYMDDGNLTEKQRTYILNTQGFENHECKFLCNVLEMNFNIKSTVIKDKNKWKIRIRTESADLFKTIIFPYVHSVFYYKLAA
jgi:hypothetical protein